MWQRIRRRLGASRAGAQAQQPGAGTRQEPRRRGANLFEAAAVYIAASADGDGRRSVEAASRVSPEALFFGVDELACRAVIALARERDESPHTVARELLGVTPAEIR